MWLQLVVRVTDLQDCSIIKSRVICTLRCRKNHEHDEMLVCKKKLREKGKKIVITMTNCKRLGEVRFKVADPAW